MLDHFAGFVKPPDHADGFHMAGLCRLLVKRQCRSLVLCDAAPAGTQHVRVVVHAPVQATVGGQPEPIRRNGIVGGDAPAIFIAATHHIDGHRMIGIGGALEPCQRGFRLARHAHAVQQHLAVDGPRFDQSKLSRGPDPGGVGFRRTCAQLGQLFRRGRRNIGGGISGLQSGFQSVLLARRQASARFRASASPTSVGKRRTPQAAMSTVRSPS
ncbi:hypothetical protein D3C78_1382060 [compost metagenome]